MAKQRGLFAAFMRLFNQGRIRVMDYEIVREGSVIFVWEDGAMDPAFAQYGSGIEGFSMALRFIAAEVKERWREADQHEHYRLAA